MTFGPVPPLAGDRVGGFDKLVTLQHTKQSALKISTPYGLIPSDIITKTFDSQ